MRVLLINPPLTTSFPAGVYPMGLGYIGAVLRQLHCDVEVLDIRLNKYDESYVKKFLKKNSGKYDLAGIGGMVTAYRYIKWLAETIKKYNKRAVVCAGGSVSTAGELLLKKSDVDIVCKGEGEKVVTGIVEAMRSNLSFTTVPNILMRSGYDVISTKYEPPMEIDSIPFPAWDLFDMETYTKTPFIAPTNARRITMIIERGCPFECTFCYRNFGRVIRYRNVEKVIEEMKEVVGRYGIGHIDFLDEIFNANTNHVKELCNRIIQEGIKITWRCIGRTNLADKETLQLMYDAGCRWVGYGVETGSQEMLDRMRKKQKIADIEKSIRISREVGLVVTGTFIIGMPGETEETVRETRDFFERNKIFNVPFFPVPFPGTFLYDECLKKGLIRDEEKFIYSLEKDATDLVINLTDMPDRKLIALREGLKNEFGSKYPVFS